MENNCVISIIIPYYKGKKYIHETVKNTLNIKHEKEILIIDDGSPDHGFEYCKELFSNQPEVRVLKKINGGVADTRNFGIAHAKGDYICFVDQDDTIVAETVDKAIDILSVNNCDMLFWTTMHLMENGTVSACGTVTKDVILEKNEIVEYVIKSALITEMNNPYITTIGHIWATLMRTDFIRKKSLSFKYFVAYEDDTLFLLDYLSEANSVCFLHDVGYYWLWNHLSTSSNAQYIDNIVEKMIRLGQYELAIFDKHEPIQEQRDTFQKYFQQRLVIRAIRNNCRKGVINKERVNEILNYVRKNHIQNSFSNQSIKPRLKHEKAIYWLIEHRLYHLAICFEYIYSVLKQ